MDFSNTRINEIDIIKALAIIIMVWGHVGLPGTKFLYLFHMAVFFICSGFVYKDKYARDIKSVLIFLKKKIMTLYFPYVICAVVFTLLNNVFIKIGFYDENVCPYLSNQEILKDCIRALLFSRGTQLGGATWFLRALFFISVFYCFFNYITLKFKIINNSLIQLVISSIFLILLYYFGHRISNPSIFNFVSNFILGYFCFSIGNILKEKQVWLFQIKKSGLFGFLTICISLFILLILNNFGSVNIDRGNFTNPFFFLMASIAGFFMLFSVSVFICYLDKMQKVMLLIGKNTLSILVLHLLVFKFMNLLYVKILNFDDSMTSAFPTFANSLDNYKYVFGGGVSNNRYFYANIYK